MKTSGKLLLTGLIATIVLVGASLTSVSAQENALSERHINHIRDNCVSAKNTLSQLHASDALLRVNRGQLYESISTKLMSRFNTRVSNNGFNNSDLVSVTTGYGRTLDAFRSSYQTYEEQLSVALRIDCQKNPTQFYEAVASARTKRSQVNSDIIRLNRYIDDYQKAVEALEKDINQADRSIQG